MNFGTRQRSLSPLVLLCFALFSAMFLAACGLLIGGVFAARTVFMVEDGVIKPVEFSR